uniref:Uncharacterized protein n=1 Tax=Chlamydomonas euryale TaxID=1486919 RepID=A0A7R9YT18_9CHLO|mmetsp:Transcript_22280/g.66440  ORF Transcript_22280/g.66440 Transcript_22280/m.66440 type:complete len:272 (+) Transcript_22280:154-969(+)
MSETRACSTPRDHGREFCIYSLRDIMRVRSARALGVGQLQHERILSPRRVPASHSLTTERRLSVPCTLSHPPRGHPALLRRTVISPVVFLRRERRQNAGSYDESVYEQLATRQQPLLLPQASAACGGRPGDNVDVKLCGACQGTGVQVEEYNHRRLEKFCQPCGGRGANVYKDGKEVADPVMQADGGASISSERSARAMRRGAAVSAEAGLAALDAKLRQYADERVAALSGGSSDDAEGRKLRLELVAVLDAQIGKLSRMRETRAARLDEC